jgi:hypothetical protein
MQRLTRWPMTIRWHRFCSIVEPGDTGCWLRGDTMALHYAAKAVRRQFVMPPTTWGLTPWGRLLHFATGCKRESIKHGDAGEEINR